MVELITVMVLIGVLGAVGAVRFFDRKSFDADQFTDQTKAMLRYAQKLAIAQNRAVYVRLNGSSVALCFNYQADATCGAGNRVLPPGASNSGSSQTMSNCNAIAAWACEAPPSGITYALSQAYAYFYFDALGKPYAPADPQDNLISSFAGLVITIKESAVGGPVHAVTVAAETGYVY